MKNIYFTLVCFVCSTMVLAQGVIKVEPFISIEKGLFPGTVTFGQDPYEKVEAGTITLGESTSSNSPTGFYLSGGAVLEYPLTKQLSLRGGVAYADRQFTAKRIDDCPHCDMVSAETIFKVSYIDIPIAARYYFLANRFNLYTDAGITTSPRVENETMLKYNRAVEDAPINKVMLMAQFGMGAGIRFNKGGINLTAVYRNGLTKFAETDNYRFKSWGANLSYFFKIGDLTIE